MSKKLLYIVLAACLLVSLVSTAFAQGLDLDVQVNEETVTLSGNTTSNGNVSIFVERADGKRSYINQIKANDNGEFSLDFTLEEGNYNVNVTAESGAVQSRDITIELTPPPSSEPKITVGVKIIGKSQTYFDSFVDLPRDKANAFEALIAACSKAGISYKARDNNYYVYEIAGEEEDLTCTAGWKYLVNGDEPGKAAILKKLEDGDEVIWFWAESYRDTDPGDNEPELPQPPQLTEEQQEAKEAAKEESQSKLENIRQELSAVFSDDVPETYFIEVGGQRVLVVGADNRMSEEEQEYLKELFENNRVREEQEAKAEEDNVIRDEQGEVELNIEAGALSENTVITIEEEEDSPEVPATHRRLSNVYDFGPDGLEFKREIRVSLPVIFDNEVDPEDIVLAWYDEKTKTWVAIPAVVDLANGRVIGILRHFTKVAVLVREKEPLVFADISADKFPWAIREVSYLSALGIVNGMGDGRFAPREAVTRAQFIKMIVEALAIPESDIEVDFSDVQKDKWYYPYLQRGVAAGIVQGNADGTFAPNREITRQEMAVILFRALKLLTDGLSISTGLSFADKQDIAPWAKEAVAAAAEAGLVKGFADNTFRPEGTATRAQSAVVIYRLLQQV